jgi:hypothetical protein
MLNPSAFYNISRTITIESLASLQVVNFNLRQTGIYGIEPNSVDV